MNRKLTFAATAVGVASTLMSGVAFTRMSTRSARPTSRPRPSGWGSNWPHPSETTKPDDARLLDLLAEWAPSEATRRRILVENPEILYGFAKAS